MDELEEKLGAILNNPQMMQQIQAMAQGFQEGPKKPSGNQEPPRDNPFGDIDLSMIQRLSGLARQSSIDKREQALLGALGAYLTKERIGKLEKAMKAAKLAKIASFALGQGGQSLIGR